ncbi:hypothetical protein CDD81_2924 [Ophiocordyceps australis]|uniref:Uncharacterized protein n=1 Tax=Ophiocordyceps australis TaxID=1399860 RepID=A0A2C5YCB7_9HYPO|nr:hypothetical protein CDD81_2924 [Ophiocordyceps australis]
MLALLALLLLPCLPGALASYPNQPPRLRRPIPPGPRPLLSHGFRRDSSLGVAAVHEGSFEQLIDHANPSLGTFWQRYWWNADHYGGPTWPIVLNAPGESSIDGYQGYATNTTLPGAMAQAVGGAAIVLEHRYWGRSSPYANLTAATLQHLTLQNAMRDVVRFAHLADLPFVRNASANATQSPSSPASTPWVLSGCSYPGALTAWLAALAPGTFAAYHTSSAVVQALSTMCEYFAPVERAMPSNCSSDFRRIIAHVDQVLAGPDDTQVARLKQQFGFADLRYNDDFAAALVNGLFDWQNTQFYTGYDPLHRMCDYIENMWPGSNATDPGARGVGLLKATAGFAKWSRDVMIPGSCVKTGYWSDKNTTACYDTHDASSPVFADTSVANTGNRQWMWLLCNEPFEYWQACGPGSEYQSGLVPKLLDRAYWRRQCALFFPDTDGMTYGLRKGRSVDALNALTGGWGDSSITTAAMAAQGSPARGQPIIWTNGEFDPWRPATVSADRRPGGPLPSGDNAPVWIIPRGSHCNDLLMRNGEANADVARIQRGEIDQVKRWVQDFYARRARGL